MTGRIPKVCAISAIADMRVGWPRQPHGAGNMHEMSTTQGSTPQGIARHAAAPDVQRQQPRSSTHSKWQAPGRSPRGQTPACRISSSTVVLRASQQPLPMTESKLSQSMPNSTVTGSALLLLGQQGADVGPLYTSAGTSSKPTLSLTVLPRKVNTITPMNSHISETTKVLLVTACRR